MHSPFVFSLHILHLSFHKGCINEINFIAEKLDIQVTSFFIPDIAPGEWDGYASGNALYNVGHKRAACIWNKHKDYFNQFDAVITSDTAPLSRIFLQNNYTKPLIVWICNRFDYCDTASLDCDFPDQEYYQLLSAASQKKNVYLVPYTAFESFYALQKGVACNRDVIKPIGFCASCDGSSAISSYVNRQETFFIPPYLNDVSVDLEEQCSLLGILAYRGRYNGPYDLADFKGIIHAPYAWSNVAFFENTQQGIPYFVPSVTLMQEWHAQGIIWWQNNIFKSHYQLSEWYNAENSEIITYFDSWQDLKNNIELTDFVALRAKIKQYAGRHVDIMLSRWRAIFDEIITCSI